MSEDIQKFCDVDLTILLILQNQWIPAIRLLLLLLESCGNFFQTVKIMVTKQAVPPIKLEIRFCQKNTAGSESCNSRKPQGQRNHDDRLSKQGEENGLSWICQVL